MVYSEFTLTRKRTVESAQGILLNLRTKCAAVMVQLTSMNARCAVMFMQGAEAPAPVGGTSGDAECAPEFGSLKCTKCAALMGQRMRISASCVEMFKWLAKESAPAAAVGHSQNVETARGLRSLESSGCAALMGKCMSTSARCVMVWRFSAKDPVTVSDLGDVEAAPKFCSLKWTKCVALTGNRMSISASSVEMYKWLAKESVPAGNPQHAWQNALRMSGLSWTKCAALMARPTGMTACCSVVRFRWPAEMPAPAKSGRVLQDVP